RGALHLEQIHQSTPPREPASRGPRIASSLALPFRRAVDIFCRAVGPWHLAAKRVTADSRGASPRLRKTSPAVPIALRRHSLCSLRRVSASRTQACTWASPVARFLRLTRFDPNHNDRPARSIGSARSYGG